GENGDQSEGTKLRKGRGDRADGRGGGKKTRDGLDVITRSEEYLARVSTELANEALIGAQYTLSPDLPKELKKLDQGTQMSRHGDGTDTR
uniref:Uncharacterized protein n=1 Tax=Vombatus ursinus TaxID=29139 RepID=A0A4X2KP28_VOMUR